LRQGLIDCRLAAPRRQLQNPQILLARTLGLLGQQPIVRLPKTHRRKQVRLIAIAGERPRLAHQTIDDVPIVDVVLVLAPQPRQHEHFLVRVKDADRLGAHPRLHPLANQPRRHRVAVALHADRRPPAHTHP
jgi:hypothetical protein